MKKTSKLKKAIKSRLGMTYVELMVALSLLAIVIVSFTPMLLSSYGQLYNAGEKTQDVYNSREEIEEGLARRDSEFKVNLDIGFDIDGAAANVDSFFESINITGRKIISTFESGLETIFGQIRARLEIVSPSTVYDNTTSHDIILQTYGLTYKNITFGNETNQPGAVNKLPENTIHIEVIIPNKSKAQSVDSGSTADEDVKGTTDATVYDGTAPRAKLQYYTSRTETKPVPTDSKGLEISNADGGRIKLKICSPDDLKIDFTYSPLKVIVYYINNRGKLRTVSEYLYIEPATIIAAGETKGDIDYYTTAGIQEIDTSVDDENQSSEYRLAIEARKMRTDNSNYLIGTDSSHTEAKTAVGTPASRGVTIRSVRWIDNDETPGINPYYVMTGSEGAIYRMYSFTSDSNDLFDYSIGHKYGTEGYDTEQQPKVSYFSSTKAYIDRIYNTATGKKVYPAYWSGDFSHTFEYSSGKERLSYGPSAINSNGDATWLTSVEKEGKVDDTHYNIFSSKAQYCYYYFGDATGHQYPAKDFRTVSYILTERGWPLRLAGTIQQGDSDLFSYAFSLWDTFSNGSSPDTYQVHTTSGDLQGQQANYPLAFHYKADDPNDTMHVDYCFAQIKLKSLASYPLHNGLDSGENSYANYIEQMAGSRGDLSGIQLERDDGDDYLNMWNMAKLANTARNNHDKGQDRLVDDTGNYTGDDIEVSDVVYIPSTSTTSGSTFYVGTVHAYAFLNQTDKVSDVDSKWKNKDLASDVRGRMYKNQQGGLFTGYENQCSYPAGSISDYIILSDQDGRSTYVAMFSGTPTWPYDGEGRISESTRSNAFKGFYYNFVKEAKSATTGSTINFSHNGQDFSGYFYNGTDDQASQTTFFIPEKDNKWSFMKLDDVYFTLGYSSSRERVYKYITFDGTTEYTRAAERFYWRSHYGQDASYGVETDNKVFTTTPSNQSIFSGNALSNHKLNSALSTTGGFLQRGTYLNSYNNDQYNVWFPGDMYNLTKIASKDGVTVAVGYNVSGSVYQYAHYNKNTNFDAGQFHTTSTALGSIYNDGVLCAMVEGVDDAFVNLLYFKDNESFDGTSLTNYTASNGNKPYEDYNNYTSNTTHSKQGYGTHSRRSVDFTAVDIYVESTKSSETATSSALNYYAYYGDSHGRVFYSLIASGNATASGETSEGGANVTSDLSLVSFIKDKTYAGAETTNKVGEMTEVLINGQSLSTWFSEIVTVDVKDELIIITGAAKDGGTEKLAVGVKDPDTGVWNWRLVENCGFTSIINDATIVGGYYYLVGDGWLAGVDIDVLKDTTVSRINTPSLVDASVGCHSVKKSDLLWVETEVPLYAIAGRDTQ